MDENLRIVGERIVGELALRVPPGTRAAERDRMIDAALGARFFELAAALGAAPVAAVSAFVFPRPGKDAEGRTVFDVSARVEGEQLVPDRRGIGG